MKNIFKFSKSILIAFLFLCSCTSNSELFTESDVKKIQIKFDEGVSFDIEKYIHIDKVIKLETNNNCIIGKINNLIYHDHKFFILDRRAKRILCFNEKGRFIGNVGRQGKGPQEFLTVKDIGLNAIGNQLFILDYRKVHIFNTENLEFEETIEIDFEGNTIYNPESFAVFDRNNMYFWAQGPDSYVKEDIEFYHLVKYSKGDYQYLYPYNSFARGTAVRFTRKENGYYCVLPMNDTRVFNISNPGQIAVEYELNLPDLIPNTYMINASMEINANDLMRSPYNKLIHRFYETNKHILFRFAGKNAYTYEGLIFKDTFKTIVGKRKTNFPVIRYAYSDYYIGTLLPHQILKNIGSGNNNIFTEAVEDFEINELDNPVIFKFSLSQM